MSICHNDGCERKTDRPGFRFCRICYMNHHKDSGICSTPQCQNFAKGQFCTKCRRQPSLPERYLNVCQRCNQPSPWSICDRCRYPQRVVLKRPRPHAPVVVTRRKLPRPTIPPPKPRRRMAMCQGDHCTAYADKGEYCSTCQTMLDDYMESLLSE